VIGARNIDGQEAETMKPRGTSLVQPLPEEAFVVEAVELLACWLRSEIKDPPLWLRLSFRALQPIERQALSSTCPIGWAYESAKARLELAALDADHTTPNGAMRERLARLDERLRSAAKAELDENVRVQIGAIRVALRPHLQQKLDRRDRAAYMGARRVVR
jgi:hypothetical protein